MKSGEADTWLRTPISFTHASVGGMRSTRVSHHVSAPCLSVYWALIDANAITTWKVPTGMTSHVHAFEGHEGGAFRISLTYDAPTGSARRPRTLIRTTAGS
jgi:hypothetical protein